MASDFVAENIEEGIEWIKEFLKNSNKTKTISVFDEKISCFEKELSNIVKLYRKQGW